MRVLIAPDRFGGTLTAPEAAAAIAAGWRAWAPEDELDLCPLSDGGPGFVAALHAALGGRLVPVEVPGPLGAPALAVLLLVPDPAGGPPTGYVESAQACGLDLLGPDQRDPTRTSSEGVGVLIGAALEAGAGRIVVGLGGVASNDGGAGMLAGLARRLQLPDWQSLAPLTSGGGRLRTVDDACLAALPALAARCAGVSLVAATDVDVVLLGFKGASAIFAGQKGASQVQAQELDLALADFARAALQAVGAGQKLVAQPGAGAAGGLGFGLFLLGGQRRPGAALVAEAVGLPARLERAELAVTGEGCLDWQSLRGTVLTAVADLALAVGVPTLAIAGQVLVGRRELLNAGVESAYPVARNPVELAGSLADPAGRLAARSERVARTWSPHRSPHP